jgi:hypothetical protein
MKDDFFIGWDEARSRAATPSVLRRALPLFVLAALVCGAAATLRAPFAAAHFEFGVNRTFEGVIEHVPYPTLVVERPGTQSEAAPRSRWLLTVFGKRGAESLTLPLDGRRVRCTGSLVHRDGVTMLELVPESLEDLGPATRSLAGDPREVTLVGEVVDSKCFLGVMKPGNLKTHRACATRCISGGVPPVLAVIDAEGFARYVLLVGADGRAVNREVLEFVAERVEVRGRLVRLDSLEVLYAEPAAYVRRP